MLAELNDSTHKASVVCYGPTRQLWSGADPWIEFDIAALRHNLIHSDHIPPLSDGFTELKDRLDTATVTNNTYITGFDPYKGDCSDCVNAWQ